MALVSCGGTGGKIRPSSTTYAEATGAESCAYVEGRNEPFVVDWRIDRRGDLETALTNSLVVVAYDCKHLEILTECSVPGSYGFIGVTPKEQVIRLETAEELRASLPLTGNAIIQKLGTSLERGSTLDLALALVGKRSSSRPWVQKSDLVGECSRATHFVRSASIGAFAMRTGTRGKLEGAAELFTVKTGGSVQSTEAIENHDGALEACRSADPASEAPPNLCRSPIRIELRAIREEPQRPSTTDDLEVLGCPKGLVPTDEGKCSKPAPAQAHICSPDDVKDCNVQCEKGSKTSCAILGRAYMIGRGVPRDGARAKTLLQSACSSGVAPACGRLGEIAFAEGRTNDAHKLLSESCSSGWAHACDALGKVALAKPGAAKGIDVFALFKRSCAGGDAEGCWSLGQLFSSGVGVRKNDAEALKYFDLACTGGAKLGCVSFAGAVADGRGAAPDPKRAVNVLLASCERGYSDACSSASMHFFAGRGVDLDTARGVDLLKRACEGNDLSSCFPLAMRIKMGMGAAKDPQLWNRYITRACESGMELACVEAKKGW